MWRFFVIQFAVICWIFLPAPVTADPAWLTNLKRNTSFELETFVDSFLQDPAKSENGNVEDSSFAWWNRLSIATQVPLTQSLSFNIDGYLAFSAPNDFRGVYSSPDTDADYSRFADLLPGGLGASPRRQEGDHRFPPGQDRDRRLDRLLQHFEASLGVRWTHPRGGLYWARRAISGACPGDGARGAGGMKIPMGSHLTDAAKLSSDWGPPHPADTKLVTLPHHHTRSI